jgi:hypothetical protein
MINHNNTIKSNNNNSNNNSNNKIKEKPNFILNND